MQPGDIQINNYTYNLPDERIAKYPLQVRDQSRLLKYDKGIISTEVFSSLPDFLNQTDFLVFNDTKVIQARLIFQKLTGARIEIFLLEPFEPLDYVQIFQTVNSCKWRCIVGNLKKWKAGTLYLKVDNKVSGLELRAEKVMIENDSVIVRFLWDDPTVTFAEILEEAGQTPIPPYLNRNSEEIDRSRYQTVYSEAEGSVAAPTAGLHFTDDVLNAIDKKGIKRETVTLHVGAGTFKPVKSNSVFDHEMHTEHFIVTDSLIENVIQNDGHATAVGTTTVRTLESIYWLGVKLKEKPNLSDFHISQWEVYKYDDELSVSDALRSLKVYMKKNQINRLNASTCIMIVPGYKFKIVKKLITNFHQPQSTLLLLIAAFIGDSWNQVYAFALENKFRFLSYGDSSLLIP